MLIQYLDEHPDASWHHDDLAGGTSTVSALDRLYKAARTTFDADTAFADRARQRVVALQAGDETTTARWREIVAWYIWRNANSDSARSTASAPPTRPRPHRCASCPPDDPPARSGHADVMTPVLRSLLQPDALRVIVKQSYGLDAEECILLRSLVNDVYHVITPHRRYVLKIYRHSGWSAPEVAWELKFATHLAAAGVHVATTVPLADGQLVGELDAPEGPRPFALSDHVDGHKPQPPFDETLYRDFGRLVAQLHTAGDTFRTTRPRKPFTLQRILDEPLAATLPTLAGQPDTQSLVRDLAAAARHRVAEHAHHLDWGPCHGDVTLDNVHLTDHGLTIHDFDLKRLCVQHPSAVVRVLPLLPRVSACHRHPDATDNSPSNGSAVRCMCLDPTAGRLMVAVAVLRVP